MDKKLIEKQVDAFIQDALYDVEFLYHTEYFKTWAGTPEYKRNYNNHSYLLARFDTEVVKRFLWVEEKVYRFSGVYLVIGEYSTFVSDTDIGQYLCRNSSLPQVKRNIINFLTTRLAKTEDLLKVHK
jgi:hypothetical protein